jgi:hypothetical protein
VQVRTRPIAELIWPSCSLLPRPRISANLSKATSHFGGEIECLFWAGHPAAKEGKHQSEVPLVEDAERLSARARRAQKLSVGALPPVLHVFYMTTSLDL